MEIIKRIITKAFFGNKYVLKIKYIGEKSKVGLLHNFLNGKYIEIGKGTSIGRYCKLHCYDRNNNIKYTPSIKIGNDCMIGQNFSVMSADSVIIEDKVLMASYITIVNENHGMNVEDELDYRRQPLVTAPVIIKEGAWIGERCCILSGVTIGKRSIIGSGSIVNKSIPDYCIAVGSPARVIKKWNFQTHQWESVNKNSGDNNGN